MHPDHASTPVDLHAGKPPGSDAASVVFVTLHRCASTLFSSFVLRNARGLRHIDYLGYMYANEARPLPVIRDRGYVYGPIRLQDSGHPRESFVNALLDSSGFRKARQLYWVRDPRDILVSMYYSFGASHGISKVPDFRDYQLRERQRIGRLTLDEYVLEEAPRVNSKLLLMKSLLDAAADGLCLRYEDMVRDFDRWFADMAAFLPVDPEIRTTLLQQTRPRSVEQPDKHKRSGKIAGFRDKLPGATITRLNAILGGVLHDFGYSEE